VNGKFTVICGRKFRGRETVIMEKHMFQLVFHVVEGYIMRKLTIEL
jgi:hypothetical protein